MQITIDLDAKRTRRCGGCTLCCKLLPMYDYGFDKPAGKRCPHQRTGKGCAIYGCHPPCCKIWACGWLSNQEATPNMSRPDRTHYVIDPAPDFITLRNKETGEIANQIPCIQVWLDPDFPEAHRDPALREFLAEEGKKGLVALIRTTTRDGWVLAPPTVNPNGKAEWYEAREGTAIDPRTHTAAEKEAVLGEMNLVLTPA